MPRLAPSLLLPIFCCFHPFATFAAPNKADRKVVNPGESKTKPALSKGSAQSVTTVPTTAFVRILHAVPGGPTIDVFDGSLKIAFNRGFTGLTSYQPVKSGKKALKVFAAGKTSPTIAADSFTFARGSYYTVAVYGKKAPQLLSINESKGKDSLEKARVRVVHLAPGAPELSVTLPSTRGDLGYAKLLSKPLEYGKSGSKLLAPKATILQIRDANGKILKATTTLKFEAGKRYSAFIIGEINGQKSVSLDVLVKSAAK